MSALFKPHHGENVYANDEVNIKTKQSEIWTITPNEIHPTERDETRFPDGAAEWLSIK